MYRSYKAQKVMYQFLMETKYGTALLILIEPLEYNIYTDI